MALTVMPFARNETNFLDCGEHRQLILIIYVCVLENKW